MEFPENFYNYHYKMALGKALFHLVSIRGTILEKDYVKRHLPNLITCEDYSPFVSNMRHIIKMQNFPSKCNSLRKCSLFFSLPYSFIQVGKFFCSQSTFLLRHNINCLSEVVFLGPSLLSWLHFCITWSSLILRFGHYISACQS